MPKAKPWPLRRVPRPPPPARVDAPWPEPSNFQPVVALAHLHGAAFESTLDIDLGRGLGEGEIARRGSGPDLGAEIGREELLQTHFRFAMEMSRSIASPSSWWNIGVGLVVIRPGTHGPGARSRGRGAMARHERICTGELGVRARGAGGHALGPMRVETVQSARRGDGRGVHRAKCTSRSSICGPSATAKPMSAKIAVTPRDLWNRPGGGKSWAPPPPAAPRCPRGGGSVTSRDHRPSAVHRARHRQVLASSPPAPSLTCPSARSVRGPRPDAPRATCRRVPALS